MLRIVTTLLCIICFAPLGAMASSVIFSRDVITIQTLRIAQSPESEESLDVMAPDGSDREDMQRRDIVSNDPIVTNHPFIVTIKNIETTDPEWIVAQNELRRDYGILYLYPQSQKAAVKKSDNRKSYDILFIDNYGGIHAIAKNITPATLLEPIEPNKPTKALLYLNSGATDAYDIKLNDTVLHKLFPQKPNIITE